MYQIDNQSRQAVYEQIVGQVERYILTGVLQAEEQMPSVRSMSMELHLNPNTVQRAYTELERRGIIFTVVGKGSFVSSQAKEVLYLDKKREIVFLKEKLSELAAAGISKEEIAELVEEVYRQKREEKQ